MAYSTDEAEIARRGKPLLAF